MKFTVTNNGVALKIEKMMRDIPKASDTAARIMGEAFVANLKGAIEGQSIPMAPLSAKWLAEKSRKGLDTRILIAFRAYIESIVMTPTGKGRVEVSADSKMQRLLEYGTKTMPARPHWRPAMKGAEKAKKQAMEVFRDILGL